ncbi:MAG: prepilin-type N-terminal cleavage/methylation domain-containing protein [Magnetococcus sp. DMHC-6]
MFIKRIQHHKEKGFSLVELAIVMVIIGLIVSAIAVGRTTMRKGEAMKAYQQWINPLIQNALNNWANTNDVTQVSTGGQGTWSSKGWGVLPPGLPQVYNYGGGTLEAKDVAQSASILTLTIDIKTAISTESAVELDSTLKNAFQTAETYTGVDVGTVGGSYVVEFAVPSSYNGT